MNDLVLSEEYLLLDSEVSGHRVVLIGAETLGSGDDTLGKELMLKLLSELAAGTLLPVAMILYNSGVLLADKTSKALEDLVSLERHGMELLVCETSLTQYNLQRPLSAGRAVAMAEIADCLMKATTIIRP